MYKNVRVRVSADDFWNCFFANNKNDAKSNVLVLKKNESSINFVDSRSSSFDEGKKCAEFNLLN